MRHGRLAARTCDPNNRDAGKLGKKISAHADGDAAFFSFGNVGRVEWYASSFDDEISIPKIFEPMLPETISDGRKFFERRYGLVQLLRAFKIGHDELGAVSSQKARV